uniref:CAZy families GT28 protein n=1 Tax=uncultured Streptomyces sp. TaxID=174707 RepID=A0A060C0D5_9ACTN|nr:CAZy families GT28 protein [uncultured Streptomyces sp.]
MPIGNGNERRNAQPVVDAGGAIVVENADFTPQWVRQHVIALVSDPARLSEMGAKAAGLVPRDADDTLAQIIQETASDAR